MRYLALVLLAGCAQEVTPCGLLLEPDGWLRPSDLQEAEQALLARGPLTTHPMLQSRDDMCARLEGTVVKSEAARWLAAEGTGREADGEATCAPKRVRIVQVGEHWQFSSLAHELAHILTGCDDHVRWTETGLTQQLINIYFTSVPDEGVP